MIPTTAVTSPKATAETAMIAAMTRNAVRRPLDGMTSGPALPSRSWFSGRDIARILWGDAGEGGVGERLHAGEGEVGAGLGPGSGPEAGPAVAAVDPHRPHPQGLGRNVVV